MLQCRDIDDLLIDWLYEELDEDASEGVEVHAEQCARCANELNSLKQTREAFREIPEEDPPAAASAILLHEAARRAPAPSPAPIGEESPGLLDRFLGLFRPLALHPAATAVASLLIIGGVFGTLYVKQGHHDVATPRASSGASAERAVAPAEAAEPEAAEAEGEEEVALDEEERLRVARGSEDSYAPDLLDSERRRELDGKVAEADQRERGVAQKGFEGGESAKASRLEKKERPARRSARRSRDRKKKAPQANAVTGADPLIAGGIRGTGSGAGDAPPPAGPKDADADAEAEDGAEAEDDRFRPYKPGELAWAKQQEERLSKAVSDKRCRRAADIANDILDRNPDYYTRRVKDSKEVKRCRWYVQKERSRRLARRKREAQKKAGGKSDKASRQQAAPARDEAAVESD